jgi:methionine-rich copper-binding protein CopC
MPRQGRNKGQITAEGQTAPSVAVGVGWGATGSAALTTGANDVAGQVVVTAAGGTYAQATATVTITFGTPYATAPRSVQITNSNAVAIDTGHTSYSVSTTALTITYKVLPAAGVYTFDYLCIA